MLRRKEITLKPRHRLALRVVRNRMEIGPDHLIQPYAAAQTWSDGGNEKASPVRTRLLDHFGATLT